MNAPTFCCYLSKVLLQKETMGYARVIHKKKKKKVEKTLNKCPRYLKQWVLRCLSEKKKREQRDVLLQMLPSFKREITFQGA